MMLMVTLFLIAVAEPFDPGKVSFSIAYRDEMAPYRIQSTFLLPREPLRVTVDDGGTGDRFTARLDDGARSELSQNTWLWTAPEEPGHHLLELSNGEETVLLNIFVMVPLSEVKDGYLEGYRIGAWPDKPLRGNPIYQPPRGLDRVTPEMLRLRVSPHFTLGQFLCKQQGGYPKFLALRARLLLKLEYLLEKVNQKGLRCDSFTVMSGFRTPYYNKAIGNVAYSRHQWGGAADIFIDESPRDGYPDDLNGDGQIDRFDALVLYELIDAASFTKEYKAFVGGLGRYRKTAAHGPFVHVDVRGFKARWGE